MPCAPLHITKMDFKTVHPLNILSTDFITIYPKSLKMKNKHFFRSRNHGCLVVHLLPLAIFVRTKVECPS